MVEIIFIVQGIIFLIVFSLIAYALYIARRRNN